MNTLNLRVKNYVLQWLNSLNHTNFEFPVLLIIYLLNDQYYSWHLLQSNNGNNRRMCLLNLVKVNN